MRRDESPAAALIDTGRAAHGRLGCVLYLSGHLGLSALADPLPLVGAISHQNGGDGDDHTYGKKNKGNHGDLSVPLPIGASGGCLTTFEMHIAHLQ